MNDLVRRLREYGRPVALLDWLDTTPYATEVSVSSFKISPEAEWEKVFAEAESRLPNYRKNITSFFQGQFDRFRRAFHELSVPELEQIREWATKHTGQRFVVKLAAEWSAPLFDFEDSVPVPDRVRLA